jgi:hypothetical protein
VAKPSDSATRRPSDRRGRRRREAHPVNCADLTTALAGFALAVTF